ncbi:MAG: sulfotransferase domain-containing protein [Planctomycetota bacterium]
MLALDVWDALKWVGLLAGIAIAVLVVQMIHLSAVFAWGDARTRGLAYYGATPARRAGFKKALRVHGVLLFPILRFLGKTSRFKFENATFVEGGVPGPRGTCSPESFAKALEYQPRPDDVFVATQMKCGTTWMQHLVYEIALRGQGDLVATGRTLYSVSPWLEALKSVSIDEAAVVGDARPCRVIKTHLPASACPMSGSAKYVYVARHPVSCFASCVDFVATNVGTFAPPLDVTEKWFCSDELMWWGTWPAHVQSWWDAAAAGDNVLFVFFEDMKRDLAGVAERVAAFLDIAPLSAKEMEQVVSKCSFGYMKEHGTAFEMHPPHILQTDAELFVSGSTERHKDVPDAVRERVGHWCRDQLEGHAFPLAKMYPDVC